MTARPNSFSFLQQRQFVAHGNSEVRRAGEVLRALGVVLHFVIAFGAATVYYVPSRKLTFLTRRAVVFGLLYGAVVYLFMHLVVLPLSAVTRFHVSLVYHVAEFVEHWFFVGLPIALSVRRFAS